MELDVQDGKQSVNINTTSARKLVSYALAGLKLETKNTI